MMRFCVCLVLKGFIRGGPLNIVSLIYILLVVSHLECVFDLGRQDLKMINKY